MMNKILKAITLDRCLMESDMERVYLLMKDKFFIMMGCGNKTNCTVTALLNGNLNFLEKLMFLIKDFRNHKFHGKGSYSSRCGNFYEGEYINGLKHGKGKEEIKNQGVYEGYFEKALRSGKGILKISDREHYDGNWKKGKKHG